MAYGQKGYRKSSKRAPAKRKAAPRSRSKSGGGIQTVRLVLETAPASPARSDAAGYPFMQPTPRNTGKAKR